MTRAYYNEIDPFAADWLRHLITNGHIAPGDVDTRSIEDVHPDDLQSYTQCHFFAGIGVWSYALRQAGWSDDRPVWTGSCPCQPFSAAGKGAGFTDERHLWPSWFHLIQQCQPRVIFGEQVASKNGLAWLDLVHTDLEAAGYAIGAVDCCAAGVGAPHIRQRLWFVAERMDDSASTRCSPTWARQPSQSESRECRFELGRKFSGLGNTDGEQQDAQRGILGGSESQFERRCGTRGMANSDAHGRSAMPQRDLFNIEYHTESRSGARGLGDTGRQRDEPGREIGFLGRSSGEEQSQAPEREWFGDAVGDSSTDSRTSPLHGFWGDADWLYCRDGKWRPVEPGTFPLAHGITNRVGLLRGYGNAINAEAAVAFIASYRDVTERAA